MKGHNTFGAFVIGAVLVVFLFILMGASSGNRGGRYHLTVARDGLYVIDTQTGQIKVVKALKTKWESGTTVLDWKTNYTELKSYKEK
ncbi:MAG: hypothetical protein GTO40_02920 [Deltaproteobacteria bacterium]|nr:hypothetical protein [Deltaproteobacteria bacterium]